MSKNPNPFGDLTNILGQFKIPGVDLKAFIESRRKDFEALVAANQAANEAMQSVARQQAELLTQSMRAIQDATSGAVRGAGGLADPVKQAELNRKAFETAFDSLRDLAETTRKSQADALAMLSKRAAERMDEINAVIKPK